MSSPPFPSSFNLRPDFEPILDSINDGVPVMTDAAEGFGNARKARNHRRRANYLKERTARQTFTKRGRKRVLKGAEAALPARVSQRLREEYKLVKAMAKLTHTVKSAFDDADFVANPEAKDIAAALRLQGARAFDAPRVQGFMIAMLRACRSCRAQ